MRIERGLLDPQSRHHAVPDWREAAGMPSVSAMPGSGLLGAAIAASGPAPTKITARPAMVALGLRGSRLSQHVW